jgi:hypothetical protein
MLFDRSTRPPGGRPHAARWRTTVVVASLALVAGLATAPLSPAASAQTRTDPALLGLFGSTDPTFDGVYRQSLSLIALDAARATVPSAAVSWLKRQRCGNGAFTSYRPDLTVRCGAKDSNATALAVIAFRRLGLTRQAQKSVPWLVDQQRSSGGWEYSAGWGADTNSTGLVVQALIAMRIKPATVTTKGNSPLDFLRRMQLDCGSADRAGRGALDYQPQTPLLPNDFATAQATAALARSSLPVKPTKTSADRPRFDCATKPQPTTRSAAAAGYLARTIRANDGHIPAFDSSTDYGSTANAVLSLVASGYGAREVRAGVSTLKRGAVGYTHDDRKVLTASSAALALVAVATGGDPRSFGAVNPVRQLLRSLTTAG